MNEKKDFCTDFLFSKGSFTIGAGSTINLAGNYFDYNSSPSEDEADVLALKSDFCMVGKDIVDAKNKFEKKCSKP